MQNEIHIDDFDYQLPDERIAKYPLPERDASKLLVYRKGEIIDSQFTSLPDFLPADSLLIFNNSKVIQARMHFQKPTGAQIEIFCLEPHAPHDYALIFQQTTKCSWICLVGNLKKWKEGYLAKAITVNSKQVEVSARRLQSHGDSHIIAFEWNDSSITFADILDAMGELPIPPYLNRETEEQDKQTYQTIYSKIKGSVAAPTAGLHFTERVLQELKPKGISTDEVTLHVGAGTFKPVKVQHVDEHVMHAEFIAVRRELIQHLLDHTGKIVAVGTTSVRTLESLYYIGELLEKDASPENLKVDQFQPYKGGSSLSKEQALENILDYLDRNNLHNLIAETQIMIKPGYTFHLVDAIVTNFHQPKSTLLLLVSAFTALDGKYDCWRRIYGHALNNGYRFLSYGDSSLLLRD
ncbi:S-adenosylmethionine:tRNA ribosyltransferase-isomerase [Dysgonomonas sp. 25]|uniref:S-adenosylmethionine:tRNA ribosyltransferase-isomerase n=1 Tax=Dysgonomonas sp. 25 TaxID=2302933 RepID=UPI0013D80F77|nr:S-adenosylmethionine:tRNA ribosyltransferase-isomerase [Dysgonomonas sp. 25]NDV70306.1 S-adenosylmethionine:tRNA ribosyltransferase-isomerase [Dysgonomonas sp. 25]